MSWVVTAMAVSTVMGANKADRAAKQKLADNLSAANTTRYSPWTGMAGKLDTSYTPSVLEGAVGGAVQGAGMAQALGAAGFGGGSGAANGTAPYMGANSLGGQDMAAQMGQDYGSFGGSNLQFPNLQKPSLYSSR